MWCRHCCWSEASRLPVMSAPAAAVVAAPPLAAVVTEPPLDAADAAVPAEAIVVERCRCRRRKRRGPIHRWL